jgi:hypothetical protein
MARPGEYERDYRDPKYRCPGGEGHGYIGGE